MTAENQLRTAQNALNSHPLLTGNVIQSIDDVRVFMTYHVYAVWDFMCLIKSLQHAIVPSTTIWTPVRHTDIGRFINSVVLDEETDVDPDMRPISHYAMYIAAMKETGADTSKVEAFIDGLTSVGWHALPQLLDAIPPEAERFCRTTLDFIGTQQPHIIAAAFTYGRETIIPTMFTGIIDQLNVNEIEAPMFRHYLERHVHVDGETHGPIAIQMVDTLCGADLKLQREATEAAISAIENRIQLWTDIQRAIEGAR